MQHFFLTFDKNNNASILVLSSYYYIIMTSSRMRDVKIVSDVKSNKRIGKYHTKSETTDPGKQRSME